MKAIHFLWIIIISTNLIARVDDHAPISVMGDHLHKKSDQMFSVRYMQMQMKNIFDGTEEISEDEFFDETSYMMAPKEMTMTMTMLGYMYGISDKLNFALMFNYISNTMDMTRKMGRENRSMQANGIGDTHLNLLYGHINTKDSRLISKFKFLLPTGNFQHKKKGSLQGYPMQTGVGSQALGYGINYTKFLESSSFGVDLNYLAIFNENSQDYRVGNKAEFNTWYSYTIHDHLSTHLLLNFQAQGPYKDDRTSSMSPTLDDSSQHGIRGNAKLGFNYILPSGDRIAADYGLPIYRDLAGYQLDQTSSITLGYQKAY